MFLLWKMRIGRSASKLQQSIQNKKERENNMKKSTRILSMLLAVLMILSSMVTLTASAAANDPANEDHGKQPTTWWTDNAATAFAGGNGESGSPYQIATAAQLAYFANYVNTNGAATSGKYFEITADNIDMSAHQWAPITGAFKGVLNGAGKTVTGIKLTAGAAGHVYANGCAIFTNIDAATVKNITFGVKILDPVLATAGNPSYNNGVISANGTAGVAGLAVLAANKATFTNVTVDLDLDSRGVGHAASKVGYTYGGFVAITSGAGSGPSFTNCTVNGDMYIDVYGTYNNGSNGQTTANVTAVNVAGVIGYWSANTASNIVNNADIKVIASRGTSYYAGVVARSFNGVSGSNFINNGDLDIETASDGHSYIGGVLGCLARANALKGSKNTGTVKVLSYNSALYIGGVAGDIGSSTASTIEGWTNEGDVIVNKTSSSNNLQIGGIIGILRVAIPVKDCTNKGDVTFNATSDTPDILLAGLAGQLSNGATFTNCHNEGAITFNAPGVANNATKNYAAYVGGLLSIAKNSTSSYATLNNCTNTGTVTFNSGTDLAYNSTGGGASRVGGLVAELQYGQIIGCTNYGTVVLTKLNGGIRMGGITGNMQNQSCNKIENTANRGQIIVTDATDDNVGRYIGGIVGNLAGPNGKLINVANYGDLTWNAKGVGQMGGIMANISLKDSTFEGLVNEGDVTVNNLNGTRHRLVGGIIGTANVTTTLKNCVNYGTIWQKDVYINANGTAGIAASANTSTIDGCINYGEIKLTGEAENGSAGNRNVGGIVAMATTATIKDCVNNGDVNYTAAKNSNAMAGGIVGVAYKGTTVTGCTNNGDVTVNAPGAGYTGGVVGSFYTAPADGSVLNCVNTGDVTNIGVTGNNAAAGIVARTGTDSSQGSTEGNKLYIVGCINAGKISESSLSGGVIGYTSAATASTNQTDASDFDGDGDTTDKVTIVKVPYIVYVTECIGMGSGVTYSIIGSNRVGTLYFENNFGNTDYALSYYNQNYNNYLPDGNFEVTYINGSDYHGNSRPFNPTGHYTKVDFGTLDKARLRIDAEGTDASGIRFDSFISKETYDSILATGATIALGTLIAPTYNLQLDEVVSAFDKAAALDALTQDGKKMYSLIPFALENGVESFLNNNEYADPNRDDYYYFAGALTNIKTANFGLEFSAIAYLTITTADGATVTLYADFDPDNAERARSIQQIAYRAFEDRATAPIVIDGAAYDYYASADNACYLGNWSLYSNAQLAKLKLYSGYAATGEIDDGFVVNGVSIENYVIVYAQSSIHKYYGSNTGKTLYEDLSNVVFYNQTTGAPIEFGDALLGARYDYDEQTANRLQAAIKAEFGVELPVVCDADYAETPFEILVGETNRAQTQSSIVSRLDPDDFLCRIDGQKIVVVGGAYGTTWHAVDEIEALFAEIDETDYDLKLAGDLSGEYKLQKIATIGDSITRGSQSLPDNAPYASTYGAAGGAYTVFGSTATETYYRYYLSYPANLQRLMWQDAVIYNYGKGASTAGLYKRSNIDNYFEQSVYWANCYDNSNDKDVDYDLVIFMHGTNDNGNAGGVSGKSGAYNWTDADKLYFQDAIQSMMDKILEGSPNAKFMINNVPHRFDTANTLVSADGKNKTGGGTSEHNTMAMKVIQKGVAQNLKDMGYDVYHFDMNLYTRENLVEDGKTCSCAGYSDHTSAGFDSTAEGEAHGYYYNFNTPYGYDEGTHPNFRGYNKMADGVYDAVQYVLNGAAATKYMIALN